MSSGTKKSFSSAIAAAMKQQANADDKSSVGSGSASKEDITSTSAMDNKRDSIKGRYNAFNSDNYFFFIIHLLRRIERDTLET